MEEAKQVIENLALFSFNDYCGSRSVEYALAFSLALGTICFILTKVTGEMSWVDRIWPILPILYQAHFIYHQSHCHGVEISGRQWLIFTFTSVWGLRLTYNFYRKGGFKKGGEDYRWAYIRQNFHWLVVEILNLVFTAYYQIILILWFSSPIREAYSGEINIYDYVLAVLWICLFAGEVTADQQQWNFQTEKYRLLSVKENKLETLPERFRKGFVIDGLFSVSRHPNFFCEIMIWYVQYLFSHNSSGWNWTGVGAVLLNLLFLGSTNLTEKISSQKYPLYSQYQTTTSMLIPCPSRKSIKS
jgi:steroid 5-alpha reductase family enzyme